jgi:DNA-binding XRE family transcriptional regulator|nr:MAG TPA_asm: Helix-turn-helix XRE-family like protein [Caudoviricetes sp.]
MVTNKILEIRGKKGITTGQLEIWTGITRQTISRIENMEVDPKQSQMIKISKALKMDVTDVFDLDWRKKPKSLE